MALSSQKKLFLGARLKRLRRDLGVTQMRMAEDLGVSASYLNLLERNQRPVTAQVLLRLAETYDLDLRSLSADAQPGGVAGLAEVFADQMFRDLGVARHELGEVAENAPGVAEAITRLYRAYLDARRFPGGFERPEDGAFSAAALTPSDWVRDFIQGQRNYFAELEEAGEAMAEAIGAEPQDFASAARERLSERHRIEVRVAPVDIFPDALRRYDHHRKRLFLSEVLTDGPGRAFALAYQLALLENMPTASTPSPPAPSRPIRRRAALLRVSLANYLAAAVLMPYAAFHDTAERSAYDIGLMGARFGVSYEQACHRLTTLARPAARGVCPSSCSGSIPRATFPRSGSPAPPSRSPRFGGTCPRWNLHQGVQDARAASSPRWSRPRTDSATSPSRARSGGRPRRTRTKTPTSRSAWAASSSSPAG